MSVPDLRAPLFVAALLLTGGAAAEPAHPDWPTHFTEAFAAPGGCVTGAAAGEGELFLVDRQADVIFVVDPESGAVLRELPSPGYVPRGLAFDGEYLWLADGEQGRIFRIDPADGMVSLRVDAPTRGINGLAHDGADLWVADVRGERLHRLSTVDGTSITSIPSPATRTTGLAWDGSHLWVADRVEDEIYRVDPSTGDVVLTLQAGGEHPWGLAWHGDRLLVTDYQADRVQQVEPAQLPPHDLLEDRSERITFHHEIRSHGPEPLVDATISIAIPHDRTGQTLLSSVSFEPAPDEIVEDEWGQSFARFRFSDVAAPGMVGATMGIDARTWTVRYNLLPERAGTLDEVPKDIRKRYLVDGDKYRIDDPLIRQVVADVVGDETNAYRVARTLYEHVIGEMEYELAGGWNVAPRVLARGTGSCSEYSFVFIALCRAAGLPARYVGSVVRRYDDAAVDEVFHRWSEVYLPGYGWVPVDLNRGDKETPAERARGIGFLDSGLVVTTESGGDSSELGWNYNSTSQLTSRGPAHLVEEVYAEWEPLPAAVDEP